MCLNSITTTEILKKDLVVWGIVGIKNGIEFSPVSKIPYNKRINQAITSRAKKLSQIGSENRPRYKAGFHKLIYKEDAIKLLGIWKDLYRTYNYKNPPNTFGRVRKFIFQKGEKVIFGGSKVGSWAEAFFVETVVCQTMINPRIKVGANENINK